MSKVKKMLGMFRFENISYVYIFTLIMVSISTIWSLFGVKKSNLKKYLEVN